jgi:hypothetical protein
MQVVRREERRGDEADPMTEDTSSRTATRWRDFRADPPPELHVFWGLHLEHGVFAELMVLRGVKVEDMRGKRIRGERSPVMWHELEVPEMPPVWVWRRA